MNLEHLHLKGKQVKTALICKYIEEGLNKDKNQTNLDEI